MSNDEIFPKRGTGMPKPFVVSREIYRNALDSFEKQLTEMFGTDTDAIAKAKANFVKVGLSMGIVPDIEEEQE